MMMGGSGSQNAVGGVEVELETVRAKYVINCAGVASDKIARMIGDTSFNIKPRLGEYLLLHKNQGCMANRIIFPAPHPVKGKGVLVQKTLWGNLILGPTARDIHDPLTHTQTVKDIMIYVVGKCRSLVPDFDAGETIHTFCGARAKSDVGDWIIGPSDADPRGKFINVAGIDSPGLSGTPAIALHIVELLRTNGLTLVPNPDFNPKRAAIVVPKTGAGLKYTKTEADAVGVDPRKNVVCKCENVTEAEIVEVMRRSLPVDSTQAMRKRTRAGMGHCQGDPCNYDCEGRVANIIAREQGLKKPAVGRRPWPATSFLPSRWPTKS
jgi:glycerol-3-phosphate dehydrogenase